LRYALGFLPRSCYYLTSNPQSQPFWRMIVPFKRNGLLPSVFLAILALTFPIQNALAAVTRGPYLQMPGSSNIVVRWRTSEFTDSCVSCGNNLANLNISFCNTALTTEHQVTLSNLLPQTTYYYAIGNHAMSRTGNTNYHFTTAPITGANRPLRIWFVSDYGFQGDGELAVRDSYFNFAASSRPADVWLTGGDNDQVDGSDWRAQLSIFQIYSNLLVTTPIWPSLGNHDSYTSSTPGPCPFYDNFTLPTNGEAGGVPSGSEFYFSFDYGNAHFISLNSIYPEHSASTNTAMLQWLRRDLAATRQLWKIAFWHGPPYTKGSHDSDNPYDNSAYMAQMRENVLPILESYGVDLVLNGHSHVYERSYLLNGHYGYSSEFSETNKVDGGNGREDDDGPYHKRDNRGAVYVVAAVGGYPQGFSYGTHPAHCVRDGDSLGSCIVDINDRRLDFKFINENTNVLDYFTLYKTPPPRITRVQYNGITISLTWDSAPREFYQIYWQRTLMETPTLIADGIQAASNNATWSGNVNPNDPTAFYFVVLAPE
jgi:acid phosphatase type 7